MEAIVLLSVGGWSSTRWIMLRSVKRGNGGYSECWVSQCCLVSDVEKNVSRDEGREVKKAAREVLW